MLNSQDLSAYNSMQVDPNVPNTRLSYTAPVTCRYQFNSAAVVRAAESDVDQVSVYPLGRNLRVVIKSTPIDAPGQSVTLSQYLITHRGQVLDYNAADTLIDLTKRVDPENDPAFTAALTAKAQKVKPLFSTVSVIQDLNILLPEYISTEFADGADTAVVKKTDGQVWATYVTGGSTIYNGRNVVELDLVHQPPDLPPRDRYLVGYALIDPTNLMPVLSVVDSGSHESYRLISCRS
ncbi:hypothetical protein AcidC75_30890 [Acidisoma sp. C75]